jgi:hypothetical protein
MAPFYALEVVVEPMRGSRSLHYLRILHSDINHAVSGVDLWSRLTQECGFLNRSFVIGQNDREVS